MTPDHGHPVEQARRSGVDEVPTAAGTHVRQVGHVREGHGAVRLRDRTDRRVTGVVVPGAEVGRRRVEAVRMCARRRHDDVLRAAIGGLGGVVEVRRGSLGLGGQLRRGRRARRGCTRVFPHPGQHAVGRVAHMGCARRTGARSDGDALAVLGHDPAPGLTAGAESSEERLLDRSQACGVTREGRVGLTAERRRSLGPPLGAVVDEVHLGGAGEHSDTADAASIQQRLRRCRLGGTGEGLDAAARSRRRRLAQRGDQCRNEAVLIAGRNCRRRNQGKHHRRGGGRSSGCGQEGRPCTGERDGHDNASSSAHQSPWSSECRFSHGCVPFDRCPPGPHRRRRRRVRRPVEGCCYQNYREGVQKAVPGRLQIVCTRRSVPVQQARPKRPAAPA